MIESSPIFSIGIPTYDRITLLRQTIQSILNQSFSDYEIIIANDYTKKSLTYEELGLFDNRIRIINNEENLGEAENLNFLLSQAKGKYFTWQFDDDIYLDTFFESVFKLFLLEKELSCVYTNLGYIYGQGYPKLTSNKIKKNEIYNGADFVCEALEGRISVAGCCGVFSRKKLNQIGGVEKLSETPIAIHSEFLLLVNMVKYEKIGYIKNALLFSRDYKDTFSGSTKSYRSYRIAGLNLVERGISIYYKYCMDEKKRLNFLKALINTTMKFYIMRLVAVKGVMCIDEIQNFLFEILSVLKSNKNSVTKNEIDQISNNYLTKKWILVRIKAFSKWYSPHYIKIILKNIRAFLSRISV